MKTDFLLNNVAIITGASSGIGRATALEMARRGAFVALAARDKNALLEIKEEIRQQGKDAIVVPTDVTQRDQVDQMVKAVMAQWGRIDILVSNAGEYIRAPILDLEPSEIQRSLDINFFGGVYCTKAILPHMLNQKSGHIVFVTSMDGKIGLPPDAPYVSAKFALTGFCEVLRQEVQDKGVYVTNILPGRVDTTMIEHLRFSWISQKISPSTVALCVIDSIRRRKLIVIVPPQAKLLYYANVFSPRLSDKLARFFHLEGWEKFQD
jgi:uncharacterized protein